MKLRVEYRKGEPSYSPYDHIKIIELELCCKEMRELWNENIVGLADHDIQYCPFCGTKIDIEIVEIPKEQLEKEENEKIKHEMKSLENEINKKVEQLNLLRQNQGV